MPHPGEDPRESDGFGGAEAPSEGKRAEAPSEGKRAEDPSKGKRAEDPSKRKRVEDPPPLWVIYLCQLVWRCHELLSVMAGIGSDVPDYYGVFGAGVEEDAHGDG